MTKNTVQDKSIIFYRRRQNLKQQELADDLGITRTYLSFIENHKQYPDTELLDRLTKILGVTVSQIYSENELDFILYKDKKWLKKLEKKEKMIRYKKL